MNGLAGKIAWVTGAGSGIGEAAAVSFGGGRRHGRPDRAAREPLESVALRIEQTSMCSRRI